MDANFLNTLNGARKVLYKSQYNFHLQNGCTPEQADLKAKNKINSLEVLVKTTLRR